MVHRFAGNIVSSFGTLTSYLNGGISLIQCLYVLFTNAVLIQIIREMTEYESRTLTSYLNDKEIFIIVLILEL